MPRVCDLSSPDVFDIHCGLSDVVGESHESPCENGGLDIRSGHQERASNMGQADGGHMQWIYHTGVAWSDREHRRRCLGCGQHGTKRTMPAMGVLGCPFESWPPVIKPNRLLKIEQ